MKKAAEWRDECPPEPEDTPFVASKWDEWSRELLSFIEHVQCDALEAAAKTCEEYFNSASGNGCAMKIRELKL